MFPLCLPLPLPSRWHAKASTFCQSSPKQNTEAQAKIPRNHQPVSHMRSRREMLTCRASFFVCFVCFLLFPKFDTVCPKEKTKDPEVKLIQGEERTKWWGFLMTEAGIFCFSAENRAFKWGQCKRSLTLNNCVQRHSLTLLRDCHHARHKGIKEETELKMPWV